MGNRRRTTKDRLARQMARGNDKQRRRAERKMLTKEERELGHMLEVYKKQHEES